MSPKFSPSMLGAILVFLALSSINPCYARPRASLPSRQAWTRGSTVGGLSSAPFLGGASAGDGRRVAMILKPVPEPPLVNETDCFRCDNNTICLSAYSVCDGYPTCQDGSDESSTVCDSEYSCAATGRVTCPLNSSSEATRCIWPYQACNNVDDCPGGTEESTAFCTGYACGYGQSQCPSGVGCFYNATLCDGYSNCRDGSDESAAMCKDFDCSTVGKASCPIGNGSFPSQCVWESSLCNGYKECPGSTDESPEFCSTFNCSSIYRSTCPSGTGCTDEYALCDGKKDCLDGSDEDPAFCKSNNCSTTGRVSCPEGPGQVSQCVGPYLLCDGAPQCSEASDEDPAFCATYVCPDGTIKCPERNNTCVWGAYCNGVDDCSRGGIVAYPLATTKSSGPDGAAGPQSSIGPQTADGTKDTPGSTDGTSGLGNTTTYSSDEDPGFCKSYECPASWTKCGDGLRCVSTLQLCDGRQDCSDGSDESDEFCTTYNCTASGRVFCPSGKYCMSSYCDICSGITPPICPDASDQWNSSCALRNVSQCFVWIDGGGIPGCTPGQPCAMPDVPAGGVGTGSVGITGTGSTSSGGGQANGVGSGGTGKTNKRKKHQNKRAVLRWLRWWKAHHKSTKRKAKRGGMRKL